MSRTGRGGGRRTAWWSKEVQDAVTAKKIAYKRLLTDERSKASIQ